MKTTESQFEYVWGKITSKDDNLADFHLRYLGSREREDIAERWIIFWRGKAINFAETIRLSEFEKVRFTNDGRRIVIINKMGIGVRYTTRGELVVVPRFKGFSSREEQSEFIALFLDAMTACKHNVIPHKGKTCVAVIGDELQGQLDRGVYLHDEPTRQDRSKRKFTYNRRRIKSGAKASIWKTLLLVILSSPKKILLGFLVMLSPLICLIVLLIIRINSGA